MIGWPRGEGTLGTLASGTETTEGTWVRRDILLGFAFEFSARKETRRLSKSSPPRWVALISKITSLIVKRERRKFHFQDRK
jgi:hypothetical protein